MKLDRKHRDILNQLKNNGEITPEITPEIQKRLIVQHPSAPYARATVKLQKSPIKARLLICSKGTAFYNTAQFLAKTLSPWSKEADSYISDSTDFCNKICGISDPCQLVSYDVVDLFTNVPIQQALDVINEKLMNST